MAGYGPNDFARWLRQRRAVRASQAGQPSSNWDDFYEDGRPVEFDPNRYSGCLRGIVLTILLVIVVLYMFTCGPFQGDDTTGQIGSNTVATSATSGTTGTSGTSGTTGTTGTSSTTSTTQPRRSFSDPILAGILNLLGVEVDPDSPEVDEIADLLDDFIDSISTQMPAYRGPEIDITRAYLFSAVLTVAQANAAFNDSAFECGDTDPVVVCVTDPLDVAEGPLLVVAVQTAADIPTASTDKSYVYSLVFDSNGDPGNDWVGNPPFDWDFFIGSDRWYQAVYSHQNGEWALTATQLGDDTVPVPAQPSAVRVVISGDWVIWFVPEAELAAFPGALRPVTFAHDGAFTVSTRGGDVLGANPTEPRVTPPADPVPVP